MFVIGRFSKYAIAFILEDRNSMTIVEKLWQYISIRVRPQLMALDNEFNCTNIKNLLDNKTDSYILILRNQTYW